MNLMKPTELPRRFLAECGLAALKDKMVEFRDAGCRILVPHYSCTPFLVDEPTGGHLVIGPVRDRIGFRFDFNFRTSSDKLMISGFPFSDIPEVYVHTGRMNYLIHHTLEELDGPRTLANASKGFYEVPFKFMTDVGVVVQS